MLLREIIQAANQNITCNPHIHKPCSNPDGVNEFLEKYAGPMDLEHRILNLIAQCNQPGGQASYPYLPEIIETLEAMHAGMTSAVIDKDMKERWVRGLGRLVTENYTFSESELGALLLDFITEYRARLDQVK
ncbi:MAG: hypothetical protein E4G99_11910 [Anaerolineales bacterium]|nr:MAG: hypothetical protein E4G99_11910 [Anaerolineales bacterium]